MSFFTTSKVPRADGLDETLLTAGLYFLFEDLSFLAVLYAIDFLFLKPDWVFSFLLDFIGVSFLMAEVVGSLSIFSSSSMIPFFGEMQFSLALLL
jgi:hypothetical protein